MEEKRGYEWDKVGIWSYVFPETKTALLKAAKEKKMKLAEYIRQILVQSTGINTEYIRLDGIPDGWREEAERMGVGILDMINYHVNLAIEKGISEPCKLKKDWAKASAKESEKLDRKIELLEREIERLRGENRALRDGKQLSKAQLFHKSVDEILDTRTWKSLDRIARELGVPSDDAMQMELLYQSLMDKAYYDGGIEYMEAKGWRKNPKIEPVDEAMRKGWYK